MRVQDVLSLPSCQATRQVLGGDLTRVVQVAHVVDVSEIERWVLPGTFLLSTGLSWPRTSPELRQFGLTLAQCDPAAVVLAVPRYFDQFPPEVARPLAQRGIPTLELPWEIPFVQVVQQVHAFILHEQEQELRRSERIHRALTRAALSGNLADVALTLSEQLGREAAVLGRDGLPLTSPTLNSLTLNSGHILDGKKLEGKKAAKALALPGTAPRPLAGGTLVPLVLRGQPEGGVWVAGNTAGAQGSDELAVRAAEHAATVAGLLLLAQRDAEVREARLGYAFVDTLLEGQFTTDPASHERAARVGFQPQQTYTVAVGVLNVPLPLTPEGFSARERAEKHIRDTLHSLGIAPLVSVNLNQIWFLLPHTTKPERVWARLNWQAHPAPGGMVYGRARPGASGIADSRAELLTLIPYAQPGKLRSYSEVLTPRALSGDRDAQHDLMGTLLTPLRQARGADALVDTIRALTNTGFSQVEAAQHLKVHANTLRYRMERIETLTGRPLSDPQTRALWWLALQLEELHRE